MPPPTRTDPLSSEQSLQEQQLIDHTDSIMVLAAQGARRIALQQERVRRLARSGRPELVAEPRAQLRVMCEAQQIRMQLLSAAEREIIEADVRRWNSATASVSEERRSV